MNWDNDTNVSVTWVDWSEPPTTWTVPTIRYVAVRISVGGASADVSAGVAWKLASTVEGDNPELAAQIRKAAGYATEQVCQPWTCEGDDIVQQISVHMEDTPAKMVRAYQLLGLDPLAAGSLPPGT